MLCAHFSLFCPLKFSLAPSNFDVGATTGGGGTKSDFYSCIAQKGIILFGWIWKETSQQKVSKIRSWKDMILYLYLLLRKVDLVLWEIVHIGVADVGKSNCLILTLWWIWSLKLKVTLNCITLKRINFLGDMFLMRNIQAKSFKGQKLKNMAPFQKRCTCVCVCFFFCTSSNFCRVLNCQEVA